MGEETHGLDLEGRYSLQSKIFSLPYHNKGNQNRLEMYIRRATSGAFPLIVPFIRNTFSVQTKTFTLFVFRII